MMKTLYIIALAATLSANDMAWLYKEDPLTADNPNDTTNEYLHKCVRPIKPADITENRNVQRYNEAQRHFTQCINEHNRESVKLYNASRDVKQREQLKEAIEQARSDWEEYDHGTKPTRMKQELLYKTIYTEIPIE